MILCFVGVEVSYRSGRNKKHWQDVSSRRMKNVKNSNFEFPQFFELSESYHGMIFWDHLLSKVTSRM